MQKLPLLLLLLMLTISGSLLAQNPNKYKNKKIDDLTVQLRPAPGNTWLFDIMQGPMVINREMRNNPATMLPEGFASEEDAFTVAEWMIRQYKKDKHFPSIVPPHVVDKLNINKQKLYHHN